VRSLYFEHSNVIFDVGRLLDLSHKHITVIPGKAIWWMTRLVYLDLSYNNITELPPVIFAGLTSLVGLHISNIAKEKFISGMGHNRLVKLRTRRLRVMWIVTQTYKTCSVLEFWAVNSSSRTIRAFTRYKHSATTGPSVTLMANWFWHQEIGWSHQTGQWYLILPAFTHWGYLLSIMLLLQDSHLHYAIQKT
jgi:hypothetical protein